MNHIEVVGLGALNIDRVYQVERILDDGETVVDKTESFPGGSAANTIYGLARLGIRAGFTGMVGDDAEGRILIEDFKKVGVDTSHISVTSKERTGSVLCLSDRQGRRSLYVSPGANNLLTMDSLDPAYINRARLLHLSSFAGDKQFKMSLDLLDTLNSQSKLGFSPGALYTRKGLKALSPIIGRTDVLFTNYDEINELTGGDVISGAERCLELGCKIVVVTLGKGAKLETGSGTGRRILTAICYIRDYKNEYIVPATEQHRIAGDTTGAGDAFAVGFLYGFINGKGLKECGRLGDIVARFSLTRLGARQGLPTLNQLTQRYQELYQRPL